MSWLSPYDIDWSNPVSNHSLNQGRVGWWLNVPHWQGGTIWRDLIGGNHGTLTNMTPASDWVHRSHPGGWGALDMDGSDEYTNHGRVTPMEFGNTDPFSVAFWAYPRHTAGLVYPISFSNFGATSAWYCILDANVIATKSVWFEYYDGALGWGRVSSASAYNVNEWCHITATAAGTNVASDARIYHNGIRVDATNRLDSSPSSINYTSANVEIGGRGTAGSFNGLIDDVSSWDRALSASEVSDLYERSLNYNQGLLRTIPQTAVKAAAAPPAVGHQVHYMPTLGVS